ncbi:MAG: hypothetical protein ACREVN_05435 [Gammaproteobacteria bacterium]
MRREIEHCRSLLTGGALAALLGGCVVADVQQFRQSGTGIGDDEAIVILTRTDYSDEEAEAGFTECMSEALAKGERPLTLRSQQEFMDGLFPYFEPRLAPTSAEKLPELLSHPGVAEKIAENNVRYVVWVDGGTETVDQGGSMTCAFSVGGGGCFGLNWWERDSSYEASIWDLKNLGSAGNISADASGTSYVAGLIVPIPIIARTQKAACEGLAQQLKDFLIAEESPERQQAASTP